MHSVLNILAKNQLEELQVIIQSAEDYLQGAGVSAQQIYRISLIIDELFNNIVSYAYNDRLTHEISIDITVTPVMIELLFKDDGSEFNPLDQEAPDTTASIEDRQIGGLGLHLVRSIAQSMDYKRIDGINILSISLARPA